MVPCVHVPHDVRVVPSHAVVITHHFDVASQANQLARDTGPAFKLPLIAKRKANLQKKLISQKKTGYLIVST